VTSPRACGTRVAGGVYIEIPLSRTGRPLSDFIFCPPREIDLEANGLTSVGTKLMQEKSGIWHVFDVIGEDSYPNVADFIEETARLGVSRRIAKNTDFSKLTPGSCLFVIHRKAFIRNFFELQELSFERAGPSGWPPTCAARVHNEDAGQDIMCSKFWWNDVVGLNERGMREVATVSYWGNKVVEYCSYSPAIFAGFPVIRLAVIEDQGDYQKTVERIVKATNLPVEVEKD